jgi:hypothetical protein
LGKGRTSRHTAGRSAWSSIFELGAARLEDALAAYLGNFLMSFTELLKIKGYRAPRDKVICILNCCKVIFGEKNKRLVLFRHLANWIGQAY